MNLGYTAADIILNLSITILGYLLVPFIIIFSGKQYEAKKLKRINIINCAIVWLIFRIISAAISGDPGTGGAVILWGAVGQWLLNKYCLIPHSTQKPQVSINQTKATDIQRKTTPTVVSQSSNSKPIKFCSHCGNPIDPITKKCRGCGKQYFRGISLKKAVPLVLLFLATSSIVCCVCLFTRISEQELYIKNQAKQLTTQEEELNSYKKNISALEEKISELEKDKETWYNYWQKNYKKVNFFDMYVVLVEDDGTGLYHKYDCSKFKGNYFWAYNIEAAEDRGYQPCPDCHK